MITNYAIGSIYYFKLRRFRYRQRNRNKVVYKKEDSEFREVGYDSYKNDLE